MRIEKLSLSLTYFRSANHAQLFLFIFVCKFHACKNGYGIFCFKNSVKIGVQIAHPILILSRIKKAVRIKNFNFNLKKNSGCNVKNHNIRPETN